MGNYRNYTHSYTLYCDACNGDGCEVCGNTGIIKMVGWIANDSTTTYAFASTTTKASIIDQTQVHVARHLVSYQPVSLPDTIRGVQGPFADLMEVKECL